MATKQKKQQRNPANIKQGANHTFRGEDAVVNSGSQVRPKWGLSEQELALLIPLAVKGDEQAQQTLLKAYKALIENKLRLALGRDAYPDALCWGLGQDANEIPDAVAELTNSVFYRILRGLPHLRLVSHFRAWLLIIVERVANSYLRVLVRYRRLGKLPERGTEIAIDDKLNENWEAECFRANHQRSADRHDALIRNIDRELAIERAACQYLATLDHPLLLQIFKSLPPQYRDVLWDAAVNELSHDEIAQEHCWPSSTASRQKLCQAREKIDKLPLPVITVEIDEQGRTRAFYWGRTPLDPGSPFASP
jgi:DNA-directed RNA polymerase specialized sigma24 family protein